MDQAKGARFAQHVDLLFRLVAGAVVVIVGAGHKGGRPHHFIDRVVIVEDHRPPGMVVAHLDIAPVTILVPALHLTPRLGKVTVAVGVHGVVRSQHTGQRPRNHRVAEDLLHFGDTGQDVVARVALFAHHFLDATTHRGVKVRGKVGVQDDIAVRNKLAHLRLGQGKRL